MRIAPAILSTTHWCVFLTESHSKWQTNIVVIGCQVPRLRRLSLKAHVRHTTLAPNQVSLSDAAAMNLL